MRAVHLLNGLALATLAHGALADDNGLWRDAETSVLLRNYFLHNDDRNDRVRDQSYRQEWAQGFIGRFSSGFTPGTLGVGVNAHGFVGLRLDSGRGTAGTGLLPLDSDGRAERDYSSAGAALKLRLGATQLQVGEMEVETPVFDTADKRLQPEYASGWLLDSRDVPGLRLVAGHFTAFRNQNQSTGHGDFDGYRASTRGHAVSLAGAEGGSPSLGGALYIGELSDTWRQYYANLHGLHPLGETTRLSWDANLYRTLDTGQASAGPIATTASSLLFKLQHGVQAVSLGYQKIHGQTPFDFVGGDSIYLANSIKYSDFNGAGERSWQVRHDLDLGGLLPGLSLMSRYVRGSRIDSDQGPAGRHWERDLTLAWVAQQGPLKDLSLELSHVAHRGNAVQGNNDLDRVYVIVQYPLDIGGH